MRRLDRYIAPVVLSTLLALGISCGAREQGESKNQSKQVQTVSQPAKLVCPEISGISEAPRFAYGYSLYFPKPVRGDELIGGFEDASHNLGFDFNSSERAYRGFIGQDGSLTFGYHGIREIFITTYRGKGVARGTDTRFSAYINPDVEYSVLNLTASSVGAFTDEKASFQTLTSELYAVILGCKPSNSGE